MRYSLAQIGVIVCCCVGWSALGDEEAAKPGLVAAYRSLDPAATAAVVHRVDLKPAFYLGLDSPHPRIPPGLFEVVWTGSIRVPESGPITFDAIVGGALSIQVDGKTLLEGRGGSATSRLESQSALEQPNGLHRLLIRYRSSPGVPARLRIFWAGPSFAREPLPPWRLSHEPADEPAGLQADHEVERGREAAGRMGCARCHASAFPSLAEPPPGPSLADASSRLRRAWLTRWLEDPAKINPGARMPVLFDQTREGFVERTLITELLTRPDPPPASPSAGDHRAGRMAFIGLACATCHVVPDLDRGEQLREFPDRFAFDGLGDRMNERDLAEFLADPHARYPDGRMPIVPIDPKTARDLASYILLWRKPTADPAPPSSHVQAPPTTEEIQRLARKLGAPARDRDSVAAALLVEKGCASCHPGLGSSLPRNVAIKAPDGGCLGARTLPRFTLDPATTGPLRAFLQAAAQERHPSAVFQRARRLQQAGCVRCHQRDGESPPLIEQIHRSLGGAYLMSLPYQKTPRLTHPHDRFQRSALTQAVRDGVEKLRQDRYTYRMPAFGTRAEELVQALAEADGELPGAADPPASVVADPTLGTLAGPELVGSRGYGCVSCHVWKGRLLSQPDPGAVGPDLTRVTDRLRRDWFDRYVENPARFAPGTPMPTIFPHGQRAMLSAVLDGDAARQKDALWSYLARGSEAPEPAAPAPIPIAAPRGDEPALIAQIPIRLPDQNVVESLSILTKDEDLLVYDLAAWSPRALFIGGRVLRDVQARTRRFFADGTPTVSSLAPSPAWRLQRDGKGIDAETPDLHSHERLANGVRLRSALRFSEATTIPIEEVLTFEREGGRSSLTRELRLSAIPPGTSLLARTRDLEGSRLEIEATTGSAQSSAVEGVVEVVLQPDGNGVVEARLRWPLPPKRSSAAWQGAIIANPDPESGAGSLVRPGYRATPFPRPKTVSQEDRIMPGALAVHPRDGRLFVSSLKTGELFVVDNPRAEPAAITFRDFARGLFQDAYSMTCGEDGLYILHRRNLTKLVETNTDGLADRFDRVASFPQGVADAYDYGYGLVRQSDGSFVISFAPHANQTIAGSGGVLRLTPGQPPRPIAFGLRNPLGWSAGPDGQVFFTDNQGEWVATNKLGHVDEGRFFGYPNPKQPEHANKPRSKATVWIPYAWAHSVNGLAYDSTGGGFGPFAGQFFLAELMFGGAIVRADVERVNGVYQGACFPFWGKGLLGPVTLAFDPRGPLYVGGITEPGWMAQPDRGAVFRIDYTGELPFEMRSIHVRPRGFQVVFTRPIERNSGQDNASYRVERYRYEYTGAYGSPELDPTILDLDAVTVAADGLSAALKLKAPFLADHVYRITAAGVRSGRGESLVFPTGAYTLNEIPRDAP